MAPLSIPSPPPEWQILFDLGKWLHSFLPFWPASGWLSSIPIHTYAICILAGIVAAIVLTDRRLRRRGAEPGVVLDVAIPAVLLALLFARLYHVFTHPSDYFPLDSTHTLLGVFAIWEGGNAIFGALIGGAVGVWLGCKYAGLRFWSVVDAIAPGMLIAQALGRFGNYFNHELFGLPTNLPWGLQIESDNPAFPPGLPDGTLFHPTFLYEMIWNVVGLALILTLEKRFRLQWGRVFALYLIWYGLGRSWFESIRIDPSEYYFGIRANVWAAILALVLGIVIYIVQTRRHTGLEPSVYRPGREWTPTGTVDSGDRYTDTDDPEDAVPAGTVPAGSTTDTQHSVESGGTPATSKATATR